MSIGYSSAPEAQKLLFNRLKSVVVSALLGPPFAGFLLYLVLLADNNPRAWFNPSYELLQIVGPASRYGIPSAFLCGLFAIWFVRRSPAVSIWVSLTVAISAVSLVCLYAFMTSFDWRDAIFFGVFALIPALMTAPIFWRITKRWHSPESSP